MSERANNPLNEVDELIAAYLAKQAEQVDGAAGLARVQAALNGRDLLPWDGSPEPSVCETPRVPERSEDPSHEKSEPRTAMRRGLRFALTVGVVAVVVLAFVGGWYLNPVQASAKELVEEVQRVHNLPLARCYLVEVQRTVDADDDTAGKLARQVRVWTHGDRFWVEMQHGDSVPPFIWGRGDNGTLWAVLDGHRGVRVPLDQVPKALQRIADLYTLNVDTLLGDVLHDCTLTDDPKSASKLTRVVLAEPRSARTRRWLGSATLEIDNEAKALRRMTIARNLFGVPMAKVTFTLIDTRPDDDAKYCLEGHLTEPFRIDEGRIDPRVKLELVGRLFGLRKEARAVNEGEREPPIPFKDIEGRPQTPLSPSDAKATVLFFLLPDCPISNAYAPEISRICAEYGPKKIPAFVVLADPDVTVEQAKTYAKDYRYKCPVLLDPTHVLVKKAGATMAPEVAVLGPNQTVLYRGRIDDWYVDYGKRRGEPTRRDLRLGLDAVLQGNAIAMPTTKAIGCHLPEPKQ